MKEMKWKKNKGKKWIGAFCLLMTFIIWQVICPAYIFAQVKESEIESEELKQTVIEDKEEEKSVRFPNKLEAKEPPNSNQEADNVNKGIPSVASSSKAQLVENVNNANQDYPIHHGDSTSEGNDKYSADARQFITFKTKSGKTFHLIINHDEEGQNVMLLTEVSEDDLLNMVEIKEKPKEVKKMEEMPPQAEVKKKNR